MTSSQMSNLNASPRVYPSAAEVGGKVRSFIAEIALAAQVVGSYDLAILPKGARFLFGLITTDTSLGSTTIAVGPAGATAKYKAAATFTATDAPTLFGKAAVVGAEITADPETVQYTLAAATAPGSGRLVIELFYSQSS